MRLDEGVVTIGRRSVVVIRDGDTAYGSQEKLGIRIPRRVHYMRTTEIRPADGLKEDERGPSVSRHQSHQVWRQLCWPPSGKVQPER